MDLFLIIIKMIYALLVIPTFIAVIMAQDWMNASILVLLTITFLAVSKIYEITNHKIQTDEEDDLNDFR